MLDKSILPVDPSTVGGSHQSIVVSMDNILMNQVRSVLVRFLITHGPATSTEIAAALHLPSSTVRRHLALLSSGGIVKHFQGQFKAQPDAIRRQLEELTAVFHLDGNDSRNRVTEPSHFSTSPFHSNEWPGTSNRTS